MARLHTKEQLRSSFRERVRNNVLVMPSVQIWGNAFQFRGAVLVTKGVKDSDIFWYQNYFAKLERGPPTSEQT